jgi:hypothetical protein
MVEAGAHPEAIKARLGHASIRTTSDVYGHVLPSSTPGSAPPSRNDLVQGWCKRNAARSEPSGPYRLT